MVPRMFEAKTFSLALAAAALALAFGLTMGLANPASAGVTRGAAITFVPAQFGHDGATVQKANHRVLRKRFVDRRFHKHKRFHSRRGFHGKRHFHSRRSFHGKRPFHGRRDFHESRRLHGNSFARHGGRACHDVVKVGHHRGHKALIGGVMCYDRHGRGYVLDDSRHLVRYLKR